MDEQAYYDETIRLLEDAYVTADERGDIAGGSGSSSGLANWEPKRRLIANAFDHDGDWLDVGCANGLLMETLKQWTAEKGIRIEPFGLELSERIAHRARIRYPHWNDRIWTGNVMMWNPPRCFDYVTILPELVPVEQFEAMLQRIIGSFLKPGGRLVVSCYFGSRPQGAPPLMPAKDLLHSVGYQTNGEAEARREDGSLWTSIAWIEREV